MKISGIYQIQSKAKPERIYIGSSIDIRNRWNIHLNFMLRNIAPDILQAHYRKYGKDDFIFTILEPCPHESLLIREDYYIKTLKPYFNFCNADKTKLHKNRDESDYKGYWSWWITGK
jgi:group I intron endonuclease